MKRTTLVGVALAGLAVGFAALPAAAAPDAAEVTERLRAEFGLTGPEAAEIVEPVRRHLERGGGPGTLREMVRAALGDGCRGACLGESLRVMNRAMALGYAPDAAGPMVAEELHRAAADGDASGLGERLRARMERRHRQIPPPVNRAR